MKKVLIFTVIAVFSLIVAMTTVHAWFLGAQFDTNGKQFSQEDSRTGNFSNGMKLLNKYTDPAMKIELDGYKKGFLGIGWSQLGGTIYNITTKVGEFPANTTVTSNYSASGTNNVKVTWTQKTDGHLGATLIF
ncbi:MAG: hypothetical protein FWF46_01345 [Oscillospiraceae bacterium]|nr:hypothetical protein [Oscillospiraceae bacterium]